MWDTHCWENDVVGVQKMFNLKYKQVLLVRYGGGNIDRTIDFIPAIGLKLLDLARIRHIKVELCFQVPSILDKRKVQGSVGNRISAHTSTVIIWKYIGLID